jgi:2-keto-3-deoxy-L-rhamnonate aldolase RhmA
MSISGGGKAEKVYADPIVAERHQRVVSVAHDAGIKVGMIASSAQDIQTVIEWGADIVSCAHDRELFVSGSARALTETRAAIAAIASAATSNPSGS